MAKLFPGILIATLAAIPGWMLGALAASPKLLRRPVADNVAMFLRGAPHFYILFAALTLTYGSLVWLLLRALGALNFPCIVLAAIAPVVAYVAFSLFRFGYDSGWFGAALAFGIPALFIGCALWLFTVRLPL